MDSYRKDNRTDVEFYKNIEDRFLKNPFLRVDVEDIETGKSCLKYVAIFA